MLNDVFKRLIDPANMFNDVFNRLIDPNKHV